MLGLLPAVLCCLAGYVVVSAAGAVYVLAFLAWGVLTSRTIRPPGPDQHSQSSSSSSHAVLWRAVSGYSAALFICRLLAQLFYSSQALASLDPQLQSDLIWGLEVLGMGVPDPTPVQLFLLLFPPLLTGLVAAAFGSHSTGNVQGEQDLGQGPDSGTLDTLDGHRGEYEGNEEEEEEEGQEDQGSEAEADGGTQDETPPNGGPQEGRAVSPGPARGSVRAALPPLLPPIPARREPEAREHPLRGTHPSAEFSTASGSNTLRGAYPSSEFPHLGGALARVARVGRHQRTASNMSFTGAEEDMFPLLPPQPPQGAGTPGSASPAPGRMSPGLGAPSMWPPRPHSFTYSTASGTPKPGHWQPHTTTTITPMVGQLPSGSSGTQSDPMAQHAAAHAANKRLLCGVAVAVLLGACAVLWPGATSLVYVLTAVWRVQRWSSGGLSVAQGLGQAAARHLQVVAGIHVIVLYGAQQLLPGGGAGSRAWSQTMDALGLYSLFEGQPLILVALQAAHLICVHLLYVAACYSAALPHSGAEGGLVDQAVPEAPGKGAILASWCVSLLRNATAILRAVLAPAVVAAVLCCTAMLEPTALGGMLLMLGLITLLLPSRGSRSWLQATGQGLIILLLTWLLAIFVTGSLRSVIEDSLPLAVRVAGVVVLESPPKLEVLLACLLLAAVCVGFISRSRASTHDGAPPGSVGEAHQEAGGTFTAPFLRRLMKRYATGVRLAGWYAGCLAVPVAWLLLGVLWSDGLHAVYLLYFILSVASQCVRCGTPRLDQLLGGGSHARFLIRLYASLHLVALYVVLVLGTAKGPASPPLGPAAPDEHSTAEEDGQPAGTIHQLLSMTNAYRVQGFALPWGATDTAWLLQVLGLQEVHVVRDCLPVLGALLISTLHASLSSSCQDAKVLSAGFLRLLGRLAGSIGHVLLGCVALMVPCMSPASPGALGLGYLTLAAVCMALPPRRATLRNPPRASSSPSPGTDDDLHAPLLSPAPSTSPTLHRRRPLHAASSDPQPGWTCVSLLALWAALDMGARLGIALFQLSAAHGGPGLPSKAVDVLRDVIGIDPDMHSRGQLAGILLMPAALLLLVQAYRFWFAVGEAEVVGPAGATALRTSQEAGPGLATRQAEEEEAEEGEGAGHQQEWQWWIKRALILHVDQVAGLMLFGLALQAPGALGLISVVALSTLITVTALTHPRVPKGSGKPTQGEEGQDGCVWQGGLSAAQVWVAAWMLADYTLQVPWVASQLEAQPGAPSAQLPCVTLWLQWLGLQPGAASADSSATLPHTALLVSLLAVLAFCGKARQWVRQLPWYVRAAAQPGEACCLFWPPSVLPTSTHAPRPSSGTQQEDGSVAATPVGVMAAGSRQAPETTTRAVPGASGIGTSAGRVSGAVPMSYEDAARAELLQRMSVTTQPVEGAVVAMLTPFRSLAAAVLSGLAEGTTSVMDAMEIPHSAAPDTGENLGPLGARGAAGAAAGAEEGYPDGVGLQEQEEAILELAEDAGSDIKGLQVTSQGTFTAGAGVPGAGSDKGLGSSEHLSDLPHGGPGGERHPQARSLSRFALLLLTIRDACEAWGVMWGMDLHLGLLLLAALALCNVVSIVCVTAVVAATLRPHSKWRARLWHSAVLPALYLATVYQYASWVGYASLTPPIMEPSCHDQGWDTAGGLQRQLDGVHTRMGTSSMRGAVHAGLHAGFSPPWLAWLGVIMVDTTSLWLLLLALATGAMQVARDACTVLAGPDSPYTPADLASPRTSTRPSCPQTPAARLPAPSHTPPGPVSAAGPAAPLSPSEGDIEAPLLWQQARGSATAPVPRLVLGSTGAAAYGDGAQGGAGEGTRLQGAASRDIDSHELHGARLIQPLVYSERHTWGVVEWVCLYCLKYSFDTLLVCVVLVCALQRDLVHAGYLALALLLFRKRGRLQAAAIIRHAPTPPANTATFKPPAPPTTTLGAQQQSYQDSPPLPASTPAREGSMAPPGATSASPFYVATSSQSAFASFSTQEAVLARLPLLPGVPQAAAPPVESHAGALSREPARMGGEPPAVGETGAEGPEPMPMGSRSLLPGTPFWLLPAFNLLVLLLQVLYQAPLHTLLGFRWDNPCHTLHWGPSGPLFHEDGATAAPAPAAPVSCTLPQLLGFCKLRPTSSPAGGNAPGVLVVLLTSEAVADVVLWLLLRLHAKLLSTDIYQEVMLCVQQQHAAVRASRQRWLRDEAEGEARAALTAGLQQAVRAKRVAKLKGLFSEPLKTEGGHEPALFESLVSVQGLAEVLDSDLPLAAAERQLLHGADSHLFPANLARRSPQPHPSAATPRGTTGLDPVPPSDRSAADQGPGSRPRVLPRSVTSQPARSGGQPPTGARGTQAQGGGAGAGTEREDGSGPRFQALVDTLTTAGGDVSSSGHGLYDEGGIGTGEGLAQQGTREHGEPRSASDGGAGGTRAVRQSGQSHHGLLGRREGAAGRAGLPTHGRRPGVLAGAQAKSRAVGRWFAWTWRWWDSLWTIQGFRGRPLWTVSAASLLLTISDGSLLALLPTLALTTYTLLAHHAPAAYWQAALVYAESLLVLQYTYLCLANCMCDGATLTDPMWPRARVHDGMGPSCSGLLQHPSMHRWMAALGLHETARACLPMFILYLATLMYTYGSANSMGGAKSAPQTPRLAGPAAVAPVSSVPAAGTRPGWHRRPRAAMAGWWAAVQRWGMLMKRRTRDAAFELAQVYRVVSQPHEVSRHWLQLTLTWPHPTAALAATATPEARAQLVQQLTRLAHAGQAVLPSPQMPVPVAAAARDAGAYPVVKEGVTGMESTGTGTGTGTGTQAGGAPAPLQSKHDGGVAGGRLPSEGARAGGAGGEGALGRAPRGSTDGVGGRARAGGRWALARMEELVNKGSYGRRVVPMRLRLEHWVVRPDGCTAALLLEVMPPDTPQAPRDSFSGEPRWPVQPARPAAAAAAALSAVAQEQARLEQGLHAVPWMQRPNHQPTQPTLALSPAPYTPPSTPPFWPTSASPAQPPGTGAPSQSAASATSHPIDVASPQQQPPPDAATSQSVGGLPGLDSHESTLLQPSAAGGSYSPGAQGQPGTSLTATLGNVPQPATGTSAPSASPPRAGFQRASEGQAGTTGGGTGRSHGFTRRSTASGAAGGTRKGDKSDVADLGYRIHYPQPHAHQPHDLYAWVLTLDMLSFIYAALFYQVTSGSSSGVGGLVELGDDTRTLPLAYLAALMALFGLMVAERTVYTLGSEAGKMILHLLSLAMLLPWCLSHFWQAPEDSVARTHVHVFLTLRCISWALGAQQLMWGFPPLSGYGTHLGRHATLFYRRPDQLHFMAYQVFAAVPFIYELRTLLDWTCTATTLDLYSWLKLEDIRASLFIAAARRNMAAGRKIGDRVPRYSKILQGVLTLAALLLVLWVPPLVFSQGAPTYTAPTITAVAMNATVTQSAPPPCQSRQSFPLFSAGYSYSVQDWGITREPGSGGASGPPALPPLLSSYDNAQVQLVCMAQASQGVWLLSPPAQRELMDALNGTNAHLTLKWVITRSAPVANGRGAGPGCGVTLNLDLAGQSRQELLEVVSGGSRNSTRLMRLNTSDPDGALPGHGGHLGLYPLLWQARGESCNLRLGLETSDGSGGGVPSSGGAAPQGELYSQQTVSCTVSRLQEGGFSWWQLACEALDAAGLPLANSTLPPQTTCPPGFAGPQAVVVLERVQSGFLGATVSSFGITGLYVTFVYGIARLLRLSIANLRLRIPTEDLPSCRRLVTLCLDIYIARAQGELVLEEQLFRALINIYRNPQVLFELTRRRTGSAFA